MKKLTILYEKISQTCLTHFRGFKKQKIKQTENILPINISSMSFGNGNNSKTNKKTSVFSIISFLFIFASQTVMLKAFYFKML